MKSQRIAKNAVLAHLAECHFAECHLAKTIFDPNPWSNKLLL